MMKKTLFFLVLLFSTIGGYSQNISVNPNIYNTNQLVTNILVKNSCLAQISGISKRTGTDFGYSQGNGVAYFSNTNPLFPISSGVILSTGNAVAAQGPNNTVSSFSSPAWTGDADLEAALLLQGVDINSMNASVLEFNFIAATSHLSFNFLFASEEYGTYQCEANDVFVFLLTNVNTGVTTNIAVVPTTTQPVSVGNILNQLFNSACPSVNPSYFGQFNGGSNAATSATNFEGQTVMMNASATLNVNDTYHIKMVIADDGGADGTDGGYDSAIFLPEGSFNLGQELFPLDLTLEDGNALCFGETYTLDTGLNDPAYEFAWTRNNNPIPGGSSITVTQAGDYEVTITDDVTNCVTVQDILVEYVPQIIPGEPQDLFACQNATASYVYDLSVNTPIVKAGLDPATIVTYHATEQIATNNGAALPLSYTSPGGQTIWVRVKSHNSSCFVVTSFDLLTNPAPIANQPGNLTLCESTQGAGTASFDLTQQIATILGAQSGTQNTVTYFTTMQNALDNASPITTPASYTGTSQTIYGRIHRNSDISCYSVTTFNLVVNPLPVLPAPATVTQCNSYVLPALATGSYYTGSGGTGTMIPAGTSITASQTVYIYAVSATTPACSNQSTIAITIITSVTAPANVSVCQNYTLPALPAGQFYYTGPGGTGTQLTAGTVLTTTQDVYFYVPAAASCTVNNHFTVTITPTPAVADPADVNACAPYALPALPAGQNYYTGAGGTGTLLAAGTLISTTQTIYVYAVSAMNSLCIAETSFVVTVSIVTVTDSDDIVRCGNYILPALTSGNYYTGPGGTGTLLNAGTSITTTQTIYIFVQSAVIPACTDEDSFLVTINPLPALAAIANVSVCTTYTLPALPAGANYYTEANGLGTMLPAGTVISTTQTIYALTAPNEFGCTRQRSFTVTIVTTSVVELPDTTICTNYVLPALPAGNYYTGPNATGTQLPAGTPITTSQTVYIYVASAAGGSCAAQSSFDVTILPLPALPPIPNVTACDSYELPTLPVGNYYTGPGGTGTMLPAGTILTAASTTVYAYAQTATTPVCSRQRIFTVTVITGSIAPANVTACTSYTLPAPSLATASYHTAANGLGTTLPTGYVVTTTQTIYVYNNITSGTNCTGDDNFIVTILPAVPADDPADVTACFSYTLPALTNGNYYTGANGTGTMLPAGTVITATQTLHVYASNLPTLNCTTDNPFVVTINTINVADIPNVLICDGYFLQPLALGNYFTGPGGTGTMLNTDDFIDTNQTIYIYAQSATTPVCFDEESFTVTIKPDPLVDTPANVGSCGDYELPVLTNGNYFTGPGGTGTPLFAGHIVSATQDIYIYAETGGVPNCPAEHLFTVIINPEPPADVTVCGSYTLPALQVGNYFTGPAGTGTQLAAGNVINATQEIFIYIPMAVVPNCTDNNSFMVTVNDYPVLAPVQDIAVCDIYVLPVLAVGDYFTEPGGEGTMLADNSLITTSQTIYVYAETGTTPNCTDEDSFTVTINTTPVADARSTVTQCDSYTLDALIAGTYYALSGGPNVQDQVTYAAGDVITATQDMYIYAESGTTPNCFNENSFLIEILTITADSPEPVTVCDSYELPALTVGDYYTLSGGPSVPGQELLEAGDILTETQTLYVYGELGGRVNCNDEHEFVVTIYPTPVVDDTQTDFAICDEYILPDLTVGNYYTQAGGLGDQIPSGTAITETTTIYIYASTGPDNLCFDEHSYTVTINAIDVADIADFYACEAYELQPLSVGNYFTEPNGAGTQLTAGDIIDISQTIYIFGQTNTVPNCTDEESFTVTVVTSPAGDAPDALETCTNDDLGHGVFNLAPALAAILGAQDDVSVTAFETPEDAVAGTEPITGAEITAYTNTVANSQVLYIKLQSELATECFTIVELELIVHPRPAVPVMTNYELCDDNNSPDESEEFNLTLKDAQVTGGVAGVTPSYYLSQPEAEAGGIGITNPEAFTNTSNPQSVWVRAENGFGCFTISSFQLIVNPLPDVNTPAEPFIVCEDTPGIGQFSLDAVGDAILGDATGYTIRYFATLGEAETGNTIDEIDSPYATATTTIFGRVEDAVTQCAVIIPADLEVLTRPIVDQPEPLEECDPDNDHFAIFNLNPVIDAIINQVGNVTVTIHETEDSATFNGSFITDTAEYESIDPDTQTLYIRVQSAAFDCFTVVELQLIANPAPTATEPTEDYALCDNGVSDTDGLGVFDLTTLEDEIMGTLDPALFTLTFHADAGAAATGTPVLPTPASYLVATGQAFARVTNNDSGCFDVVVINLVVNPLPVAVQPTPYSLCDDNNPGDEIEIFDLSTKIPEIILDQEGLDVTFHKSFEEAEDNVAAIDTIYEYENEPTVETLFVRVTNAETDCYRIVLLDVRVEPLPIILEPSIDDLTVCDTNGQGFGVFDLQALEEAMINNGADLSIEFYETPEDAVLGNNPIPNTTTYHNVVPFNQTIYVMVTNSGTGCINSIPYEINLIVEPAPQAPALEDITDCDDQDNNGQNGMAFFDLTVQDQVILNALNAAPGDLIIHYFIREDWANEGAPRITVPNHYMGSDEQTIWVRVEDPISECYSITSFQLFLDMPLELDTPTPLVKCNELLPNDSQTVFNLREKDDEILGDQGIGQGYIVRYYENQAAADAGTPIADPENYTNPTNPKTLIVEVETDKGCLSYTILTIRVLPLPMPDTTPDALELCDVNGNGDGIEVFDLTDAELDIRNNDFSAVVTYHVSLEDAENDANAIGTPEAYTSGNGFVWVRVEAATTNAADPVCYQVVQLELKIIALPPVGANGQITPYAICELSIDGIETFYLKDYIEGILGAGADTDYDIEFYFDQAALDNGTALPAIYENEVPFTQTILVYVQHLETGCEITAPLTLIVRQQAVANTPDDIHYCDTDGTNDGLFTPIDLTQAEAGILDGQDDTLFDVTYYLTEQDATDDVNAIADPANFTNTEADLQVLWARVTNNQSQGQCFDVTSFSVVIERLPEPEIFTTPEGDNTVCIDFDGTIAKYLELHSGVTPNGHTYEWFRDGVAITDADTASGSYMAGEGGMYSVRVTSALGCISDISEEFEVIESGQASPIGAGYFVTNAFSDEQTITVLVQGNGVYEYQLDEDGLWQTSNIFVNVAPGSHTVTVRDVKTEFACAELVLDGVSVIDYPNFFTPNGDGFHDTWNIIGLADTGSVIYIFDRYGKLMKQISPDDASTGWDGTFNGQAAPATDYWFTVTYPEFNGTTTVMREFKSHFSLKR